MGDLFKMMFPDSDIASKFACGERKCAYLSTFGIAPYFQSLLLSKVKSETNYVLLFDESLNVHLQSKQMDVHVRFWEADTVATRFYTSVFLGHAKAVDLYDKLRVCCDALGIHGMLQLSMDGPNVNWKAYDTLAKDIDNETHTHLINVGSCGLHQVHNAIRAGSDKTEWNVEQVLSSLYWLFKDSPARREDYTTVTGSTVFPKQFCKHRWLENVAVIERVLEIWPHIIKFVEAASVKKGDINEPKCKSFFVVKDAIKDKLFLVKANTFLSVAKVVNPFLTKYQTDMPMLPFLADDLHKTLLSLMDRFMTEQACASSRSITKLLKSDVTDRSVHKDTSKIDIGFTAERMLRALKIEKTVSDKDVYAIKADCKKLLITMVSRLLEKSPIRYGIVRNLAWLNPNMITTDKTECVNQLKKTLQILTDSNHVSECKCDDILQQYKQFVGEVITNQDFLSFDIATSRLDVLMYQVMSSKPKWAELWHVTRKLLLLSHGQASVERGFSINKEIIVENMKEHTLIAQRCITDHLKSVGGATSVTMTKQLLLSAASARQKYHSYLADERAKKEKTNRGEKRKAVMDEIDELKSKRKRTEINRSALLKSADEFAEKAETTGKISFITKSNAFRRSAKTKEDEISSLNQDIDNKLSEIKN